ncbi:MAG: PspC domain-containing protein [Candidatus Hydrothermia bacterium]|jgi:phage shock protein PspC (stress-responsive transcriptional regulator)
MRKLVRKRKGRVLGGVCAGLAEYFNVDVVLIRLIFVAFTLAWASGLLLYILAWIIIPMED